MLTTFTVTLVLFPPSSDAHCELLQVVFTTPACLDALSHCDWLISYLCEQAIACVI